MKHIDVTPEAGKDFFQRQMKGNVVMLNLLKFKEEADYSNLESLKPENPISGQEAYKLYMDHTLPLLEKAGSEVLFYGKAGNFLIGPIDEQWDVALLVKHESVEKFMAFARDEAYLKTAGHRAAALADSRLLPISEEPLPKSTQ